jgi:hypothetical protein
MPGMLAFQMANTCKKDGLNLILLFLGRSFSPVLDPSPQLYSVLLSSSENTWSGLDTMLLFWRAAG